MIGPAFVVAGQSPGFVEPNEGALGDPTLADELKAPGIVATTDDVHMKSAEGAQPSDPFHQCTGIAAIRPDDLQSAKGK